MDKSVHLPRDPDSSRWKTEDVVKLVRPSDRIRAQVPVPTAYVGQALSFGQLSLALLELLLDLLAILNVDRYAVPLNEVFLLVAERHSANQKPAIFPVSPPQTHFILVPFPNRLLCEPLFNDSWNVVGMNWVRRIFDILLQRKAGIVHPRLIEEINDAVGPNAPGHSGNCVDDQAKVFFTAAHCLFAFDAFGDIHADSAHQRDGTGLIEDGEFAPRHIAVFPFQLKMLKRMERLLRGDHLLIVRSIHRCEISLPNLRIRFSEGPISG